MSGREWKPGDVALIEAGCHANRRVAIRTGVPSNMGWAYADVVDGKSRANWTADSHGTVSVVRPLVVIDPEDMQAVERLAQAYLDKFGSGNSAAAIANQMQAALRELANPTPPKPEEPTGLGAVVEDENAVLWVRRTTHPARSWSADTGSFQRADDWSNIAAVRVLSEGVTS